MVCFRDSAATYALGHGTAPALESTSGFRRGSVVAGRGQCDCSWSFVSSALSAYLDKRNRFSEELGARPHPVCRSADLEDSSLDPRRDWRGNPWNLFVTTRASPKYIPVKIPSYGQNAYQPAEYQCPGGN